MKMKGGWQAVGYRSDHVCATWALVKREGSATITRQPNGSYFLAASARNSTEWLTDEIYLPTTWPEVTQRAEELLRAVDRRKYH